MPRKLPPVIDFDLFGHCIQCHKSMIIEEYIDGKMQQRLSGEYREAEYLLNTGSRMRVAMCVDCKEALEDTEEEMKNIMDVVVKGWDIESDDLVSSKSKPHWTQEKKDKYMANQRKKKILIKSEGLRDSTIEKHYKDHVKKKGKKK